MNVKPRLGPTDPLVIQAFAGIYKSSAKIFFRINPNGTHQQIAVFRALDNINITHDNKTALIKAFGFEQLAYISRRMKAAMAAQKANKKPKRARVTDADGDEDEIEDEPESAVGKKNPQYSLVRQNNGLYGCFDGREGAVIAMFRTKDEAEAFVEEQLHGGWTFKPFYGNKVGG
jgi:hypothetical protein